MADRPLADALVHFFLAACSESPILPRQVGASIMRLPWQFGVPDAGLLGWWHQRVGDLHPPTLPAPPPAPATPPMPPAPAPSSSGGGNGKSKIPEMEKDWIHGWSSLEPDEDLEKAWQEYEERPRDLSTASKILVDNTWKEEGALTMSTGPDWHPPHTVKDFRDRQFGGKLSDSFADCHKGCSPFAYFEADAKARADWDHYAKAFNRDDHRSVADMLWEGQ